MIPTTNDALLAKYRFIHVSRDAAKEEWAGKPIWYIFNNRSGAAIGRILWYSPWRQWAATFAEDSVLSDGCLADVQDAIKRLTTKDA